MARKVVLAGACRTAIGVMGGTLSKTPAPDLGTVVIKEALKRTGSKPEQVDEVYMSDEIRRYIVELSRATRQDSRLMLGLSPRASLAVAGMARAAAFLGGRNYVAPQDITAIFADAARHRLRLTEQARTGGDTVQNILDDVLHTVPRPRPEKPFHGR